MGVRRQVLFVGDSITSGTGGSANYGGYRGQLLNLVSTGGLPWRVGGSNTTNNNGAENRWCGGSGLRIDQIQPELARDGVQWFYNATFLHVGTNDATQRASGGTPTLATSQANLTTMLDTIRTQQPNSRVFFALIIPNQDAQANTAITAQNAAFATQIAGRADAALITVVDQNAAFLANPSWASQWMFDNTHPNDAGYAVMAATWNAAVIAAGFSP